MEHILIMAGACVVACMIGYILVTIRNILHIKTKDGIVMDCIYAILIIYTVIFAIIGVKSGFNNYSTNRKVEVEQKEKIDLLKNVTYKSYTNEKYGYTIKYPNFLNVVTEHPNGIGASFKSNDKGETGYLEVYGRDNDSKETMEEYCKDDIYNNNRYYNESNKDNKKIDINRVYENSSHKSLKDNEYILIWKTDDATYYKYVIVGAGAIHYFEVRYSNDEQEYYEKIIDKVYKSFKTPEINYTHKKNKK